MTSVYSLGFGIGTRNSKGNWLEVLFPQPLLNPSIEMTTCVTSLLGVTSGNQTIELQHSHLQALSAQLKRIGDQQQATLLQQLGHSQQPLVAVVLHNDTAPQSVPEGYLKLQLLSHRLVKPRQMNLDGIFALLPNVAWTNQGAVDLAELPERQLQARLKGELLQVSCIDKFPKMTDYVVPSGVRIADTARVRLGAHLGQGTTIMHEGFVNFNAGTEGPGMVEGRISAGVFVGAGSDLGGGSSTMGTLSGGGNIAISVGQNCLLGANAGIGIPLGDNCTVEAGLYLTAGTKVALLDERGKSTQHCKASELAGRPNLLFRRNSITGSVECLSNKNAVALNETLHNN